MGIRVVRLGLPMAFADARRDLRRVGDELGARARAEALVTAFDREIAAARTTADKGAGRGTALYVTPGDVTTGPGSLVAEVMGAAGYRPYRTAPGWGSLPIEAMVRRPPDLVFRAFFDSPRRSEEHTSELPSLMRISYAVFCLKKKTKNHKTIT